MTPECRPFWLCGLAGILLWLTAAIPAQASAPLELGQNLWPVRVDYTTGPALQRESEQWRTEFAGPFVERWQRPAETGWAVRPLVLRRYLLDDDYDREHFFFLHPLFNRYTYRDGYAWNIMSIIKGDRSEDHRKDGFKRFEITPLIFYQRGFPPDLDYAGVFPLYGTIRQRLFYNRISWVMFPLYAAFENEGETTRHLPFPFVQWRTGPEQAHHGAALWPVYGQFEYPGVYSHRFALWPIFFRHHDDIGNEYERLRIAVLPFYYGEDKANLKSRTVVWPFFGYTRQTDPDYRENRYFWPFLVQGRGEELYINRWAPIYTDRRQFAARNNWWLWPLLNRKQTEYENLDSETWRFFYVLYWRMTQTARTGRDNPPQASKTHLWPLFSHWNDGQDRRQWQVFSPLEPLFMTDAVTRDLYSPLFAVYRGERSPGHSRHRFLFSLLTTERFPDGGRFTLGPVLDLQTRESSRGFSLLHGLIERMDRGDGARWRLLWTPLQREP